MKKNKITKIIISILGFVIIVFLIILLLKINKLQNKIQIITWEDIVDITQSEKEFNFSLFQNSIYKSIDEIKDSIVVIYANKNIEILQEWEESQEINIESIKKLEGNGIIISNDWYIITNKHVVQENNSDYTIYIDKNEFEINKIWYDDWLDLAIIKIKITQELIPAKIIKISNPPKIWQFVFALKKDPEINETIVKLGVINSKNQKFKIEDKNPYVWFLKTSTAIEPWFSGGPLIDLNGEIIWINTAIDNIEYWASYSLPITQEFINQTISSIKDSGKIIRPYIWINYDKTINWIKITSIDKWSPAEIVWLQKDDIIMGINNIDINYYNFLYQLYTYKANKEVILNIQSWNHKKEIKIKLWTNIIEDN
jgi:S1-C subfamily serine protease